MKRGEHHGALRPALLAAGLALLDTQGIEGVTIRACARAAGVSHAAPVNHFADRRALLTALAVVCMEELDRLTLTTLDATPPDPRRQLETLFEVAVRYGLAWPNRYRLMGRADLRDPADPAMAAMLPRLLAPMRRLTGQLVSDEKHHRPLLVALSAALSGYVFMRIDGNLTDPDIPTPGELLAILLDGGSGGRKR